MNVFDLHADTMMDIYNRVGAGETDVLAKHHLPQYEEGGVGAVIYALWMTNQFAELAEYFPETFPETPESAQEAMVKVMARSFREFRDTDAVELARTAEDIERIRSKGKVAVLLGLEGFYGFGGEVGMVDVMYELGVRHGMLTWNDDNEFASGVEFEGEDKGLSPRSV